MTGTLRLQPEPCHVALPGMIRAPRALIRREGVVGIYLTLEAREEGGGSRLGRRTALGMQSVRSQPGAERPFGRR